MHPLLRIVAHPLISTSGCTCDTAKEELDGPGVEVARSHTSLDSWMQIRRIEEASHGGVQGFRRTTWPFTPETEDDRLRDFLCAALVTGKVELAT
jgi:hypothetical protein